MTMKEAVTLGIEFHRDISDIDIHLNIASISEHAISKYLTANPSDEWHKLNKLRRGIEQKKRWNYLFNYAKQIAIAEIKFETKTR